MPSIVLAATAYQSLRASASFNAARLLGELRAEAAKGVTSPAASHAQEEKKIERPTSPGRAPEGDAAEAGPTSGSGSTE